MQHNEPQLSLPKIGKQPNQEKSNDANIRNDIEYTPIKIKTPGEGFRLRAV